MLQEIAEMFVTVGMCQEAVDAYVKVSRSMELFNSCFYIITRFSLTTLKTQSVCFSQLGGSPFNYYNYSLLHIITVLLLQFITYYNLI